MLVVKCTSLLKYILLLAHAWFCAGFKYMYIIIMVRKAHYLLWSTTDHDARLWYIMVFKLHNIEMLLSFTYPGAKEQEQHRSEENHNEGTNHSICSIGESRQQECDER